MNEKLITEAMKHEDKLGEGAKKRKHLPKFEKIATVMREWKKGKLFSGSGKKVKNKNQAVAIAMSEAGISKNK